MLHLLLATVLLLTLSASVAKSRPHARPRFRTRSLSPCRGWTRFIFGNPGDYSYYRFSFELSRPMKLRVTDAYCPGDEFKVYDWGRSLGSVRTGVNLPGGEGAGLCERPIFEPERAFHSLRFAAREFHLKAGEHRIEIKTLRSPIGAGYGFLRLIDDHEDDCPAEKPPCERHSDGPPKPCQEEAPSDHGCGCDSPNFHVQACSVNRAGAAQQCAAQGMKLAAVTYQNIDALATRLHRELGAGKQAWVGSYNGDSFNNGCLVFTVGAVAPAANINVGDCDTPLAVVCQSS